MRRRYRYKKRGYGKKPFKRRGYPIRRRRKRY